MVLQNINSIASKSVFSLLEASVQRGGFIIGFPVIYRRRKEFNYFDLTICRAFKKAFREVAILNGGNSHYVQRLDTQSTQDFFHIIKFFHIIFQYME